MVNRINGQENHYQRYLADDITRVKELGVARLPLSHYQQNANILRWFRGRIIATTYSDTTSEVLGHRFERNNVFK